jgi:50S ribosomal protein L21
LPDDGRFAETGRGRLKIVYKKDRLRKYWLKKTRPAALVLLRNVLFQA